MPGRNQAAGTAASGTGTFLIGMAFYGVIEMAAWGYCSFQQLITTHDSIVSILQGGVLIPSHMTPQQLLTFLEGNTGKYNAIGWTVAFVTQVLFWGAAMPGSPIRYRFLHDAIVWGFFGWEVITDLWYSSASTTTLYGSIVFVFNVGNGGWISSIFYIAAMSAGSIFLGIRGINHLSQALGPVFAAGRRS